MSKRLSVLPIECAFAVALGIFSLTAPASKAIGEVSDMKSKNNRQNSQIRRVAPPGKLVDVGGYQLYIHCTGEGSPTVVLDSGRGGGSDDWQNVQPDLAKFTRVCSYDRAGYGYSDPGPTPRTGQQIINELHKLLVNAEIEGPYVLVGHSSGGLHVRLYASQYPDEVVGMALIDPSHEDQRLRIPAEIWNVAIPTPEPGTADYDEFVARPETDAQVRAHRDLPPKLRDMPLVVLTGDQRPSSLPGIPEALLNQAWQTVQEMWAELTLLSSNGRRLIAKKSGHDIPRDQPEAVIDAIQQIVEDVRRKQE